MWIIVSLSSFERAFFSRRTHVELNKWAAIFRFHSKSAFAVMTTCLRVVGAVGLGRFELPSQGPKPRRIDQATPQPRRREVPDRAINTLSQERGFGFRTEADASFAAARTAASLVFRGLHPFALMRLIASCITRTSPAQPRPPPAPPVHRYSTPVRPSSSQIASARECTVIVSSLPRLYTDTDSSAARTPVEIPAMTSSMYTYDFAVPGSDPRISSRFGSRASFRTRSMTTPWPLRPPTTFAMRKITTCTPNVCAYADRRASSASFVAPYTEIGSHGA